MGSALIILLLFSLILVALGVFMLKGNGWDVINMPAKAKAKWDKRALCRFTGAYMLFLALCFVLIAAGLYLWWPYLEGIGFGLLLAGTAYVLIKMFLPGESQKKKMG